MKSLIVHGLTRSGTTMLERLIDGQEGMACFSFLFSPYAWDQAMKRREASARTQAMSPEERGFLNLKQEVMRQYVSFIGIVAGENPYLPEGRTVTGETLISGIPLKKIIDGMELIALAKSAEELWSIDDALGELFGLKVFATHLTKQCFFAPRHLQKENAYWIEMVRNPYDRISSEVLAGPMIKLAHILKRTNDHFRFVNEFKHERFLVVRYEDMCVNPDREIERISDFLDEDVRNLPLLNYYGEPFRPNTSKNVLDGKGFLHQDDKYKSDIGGMNPERWREQADPSFIAMVNARVDARGLYERRRPPPFAVMRGRLRLAVLEGREALRNAIVRAFKALGINISRNLDEG